MPVAYELKSRRGGWDAIDQATGFFMSDHPVKRSLRKVTARLDELQIPYAVVGGMALVAHGYERTTTDVDLLVTAEGLKAIHAALDGLGYVPPFAGSKHLRDAETGVRIEFLVAGQYPGDGVPKPVAFPDPAKVAIDLGGSKVIALERLIELKLASGMTNLGRLKDLGDVQELIRVLTLEADFATRLDESVRGKFLELLQGVKADRSDH